MAQRGVNLDGKRRNAVLKQPCATCWPVVLSGYCQGHKQNTYLLPLWLGTLEGDTREMSGVRLTGGEERGHGRTKELSYFVVLLQDWVLLIHEQQASAEDNSKYRDSGHQCSGASPPGVFTSRAHIASRRVRIFKSPLSTATCKYIKT